MPNFSLYFTTTGECFLKEQGQQTTHEFTDILEAVTFISKVDADRTATLTVYNPLGRVIFKDLLSERNDGKRDPIQVLDWIYRPQHQPSLSGHFIFSN